MRLIKFVKFMSIVTVLALIYTHMQMRIFDLAYQGKRKEQRIIDLLENNGMVTYNILQLQSTNHLGMEMLRKDSELKFRDPHHIIRVSSGETEVERPEARLASFAPQKLLDFFSMVSLKSQAEARQIERAVELKPWQRRPLR